MLPVRQSSASKLTVASTLLLAGCALAAAAAHLVSASSDTDDPFYKYMRPRLGYFSRYDPSGAYSKIYEEYFANVIKKNDQAMESVSPDDWRKVRPTGELCVDFLIGLEVKSFVMSKPYELIILDACLDWLFNESDQLKREERATDVERLDSSRKLGLKTLANDEKLREIYESTRMKEEGALPKKLLGQIYDYMVRLLHVYSENPRNGCHSLWLEAYNDFIDDVYVANCDDDTDCKFFGIENSQDDAYLQMIVESTRQASKTCYNVMQKQIRGLVETEFERSNSGTTSLKKRFMSKTNRVVRQSESEKWAREMISILQLASGLSQDSPVNLGDVVNDLYRIKNGDKDLIDRFTAALNEYAKNNADLNESKNDQLGRARFGRAMIKLCRPYTDKKMFLSMTGGINMDDDDENKKPFEFYGLIYSLVRLTNHEQLFDISKDTFEDEVIKNRWEALYLATFTCQIISTTWAELTNEQNSKSFDVRLRPEWRLMVADWPIEVLNEKLPILYPKAGGSSKPARPERDPNSQPTAYFGKKFKLNFSKSPSKHSDDRQASEPEQAAPQAPAPVPAPVPAPTPAPAPPTPAPTAAPAPPAPILSSKSNSNSNSGSLNSHLPQRQETPIMSLETIEMYKNLHGRYPQLPDFYKKIYPQLPDDLSGVYPKTLGKPSVGSGSGGYGGFGQAQSNFGGISSSNNNGYNNNYNNNNYNSNYNQPAGGQKKNDISNLSSLIF